MDQLEGLGRPNTGSGIPKYTQGDKYLQEITSVL